MSRKEEAVPRRTEAAPIPNSLGESLETGRGFTFSDAARILAEHQESIRQRIPRKAQWGMAVNAKLRELDSMLVKFKYTRDELVLIGKHIDAEAARWEKESARRESYVRWARSLGQPISPGS